MNKETVRQETNTIKETVTENMSWPMLDFEIAVEEIKNIKAPVDNEMTVDIIKTVEPI
jgi:hypothetical protein